MRVDHGHRVVDGAALAQVHSPGARALDMVGLQVAGGDLAGDDVTGGESDLPALPRSVPPREGDGPVGADVLHDGAPAVAQRERPHALVATQHDRVPHGEPELTAAHQPRIGSRYRSARRVRSAPRAAGRAAW